MIDLIKSYLDKRAQLLKLELIDVFANLVSGLATSLLLVVLGLFILFMFSFAFAFWVGQLLNNLALGFAVIGALYTLIFIIYVFVSKDNIELKIKDQIVKAAMNPGDKNGQIE